jgi:hypothetical protein
MTGWPIHLFEGYGENKIYYRARFMSEFADWQRCNYPPELLEEARKRIMELKKARGLTA